MAMRDDPAEAARIDALVTAATLCSDPAPESCSDADCPVHGWDAEGDEDGEGEGEGEFDDEEYR